MRTRTRNEKKDEDNRARWGGTDAFCIYRMLACTLTKIIDICDKIIDEIINMCKCLRAYQKKSLIQSLILKKYACRAEYQQKSSIKSLILKNMPACTSINH